MCAVVNSSLSCWHDPVHPLYLAVLFQVAIFALILAHLQHGAVSFAGGTIGCLMASMRLQGERRGKLDTLVP